MEGLMKKKFIIIMLFFYLFVSISMPITLEMVQLKSFAKKIADNLEGMIDNNSRVLFLKFKNQNVEKSFSNNLSKEIMSFLENSSNLNIWKNKQIPSIEARYDFPLMVSNFDFNILKNKYNIDYSVGAELIKEGNDIKVYIKLVDVNDRSLVNIKKYNYSNEIIKKSEKENFREIIREEIGKYFKNNNSLLKEMIKKEIQNYLGKIKVQEGFMINNLRVDKKGYYIHVSFHIKNLNDKTQILKFNRFKTRLYYNDKFYLRVYEKEIKINNKSYEKISIKPNEVKKAELVFKDRFDKLEGSGKLFLSFDINREEIKYTFDNILAY